MAVVGWWVQETVVTQQSNASITAVAVSILRDDPKKDGSDADLRRWAVDVINRTSPIKMSGTARDQLEQRGFNAASLVFETAAVGIGAAAVIYQKWLEQHAKPPETKPTPTQAPDITSHDR